MLTGKVKQRSAEDLRGIHFFLNIMWRTVLTVSLIICGSEATITCRDNDDGVVDWYILYKAPEMTPTLTGLEYIYIDSKGTTTMKPSTPNYKSINHSEGALANTLKPLFRPIRSMPPNFGFISYNDQPPGCDAKARFGHSKGVLMVDRTDSGVWLMHSMPEFPHRRNKYNFWPDTGKNNGQIFVCVTFPYGEFAKIGIHLQMIRAFPFEHDVPEEFHEELKKAANWDVPLVNNSWHLLQSKANMPLYSIAKQQSQEPKDGDVYVSIGQLINSGVKVQTWGCQEGRAPSDCTENLPQVLNIQSVKTALGHWPPTKDNSKWCLATEASSPVWCFADTNRSPGHYNRYGGGVIFGEASIKQIFQNFVADQEDCQPLSVINLPKTECGSQE